MANRADITPEICRQLLRYEPETGKLFWLSKGIDAIHCAKYDASRELSRWNSRYAGREAFTAETERGYRHGSINNVRIPAHAAAFCLHYGYWPLGIIDHINGNTGDNRICNLRDVTKVENARNAKRRTDNSSGYNGVSWCKRKRAWLARMCLNGRNKHIGYYATAVEASAARKLREADHFHANHGRVV
ncbi:MAG: HNH endonuclease [Oxalobacteraceae bacterium]|nr:MAG: HNH endonuclease [Oxalobacteraceae bacterium]